MKNPDPNPEDEAFEELALKQGQWKYTSGWRKKQIQEPSMTDKEAMAMALEALEQMKAKANFECWNLDICDESISALKERVAQRTEQEPPPWWFAVENILNEYGLQAIDFVADFKAAIKDAEQPQRTERNFCPRCGKRTKDMTHIHTCTPPKD